MATQIQIRRDTAGNWYGNNTVLSVGELAYETDTKRIKIGDGASFYNNLHYVHDPTAPTQERIDNPIYLNKIEVDDNKVQINDTGSNANVNVEIDGSAEVNISADGISLFQGEKVNAILDEDNMSTNSSTSLATQQSIKTYVDALPGTTNIGQLLDVTTSGATSGQVLKYNGAAWLPMDDTDTTLILSGESIGSMSDVDITSISDGQILKWNTSANKFEATSEFFLNLIDDDTFTSGVSAQSVASSESIKAYVDAHIPDSDLIDDDTMGTSTATTISSSESIKAYVDNTVGGLTLGASTLGALTDVDVTGAATNKILKYNGSNWIVADDTDTTLTLLDEDNFASDSDTQAPTQQSTKAYISSQLGSNYTVPPSGQSALVAGWKIITDAESPYDASPGDRLFVDTLNAPVDINLPGSATKVGGAFAEIGDEVIIMQVTDVSTNLSLIYTDPNDLDLIDSADASSGIGPKMGATVWLVYKDQTDGWITIGHDGTNLPYV
jgi:hypothetical protein